MRVTNQTGHKLLSGYPEGHPKIDDAAPMLFGTPMIMAPVSA